MWMVWLLQAMMSFRCL